MNAHEFKRLADKSLGVQLIIAGLAELVENEGYAPRDAFELVDHAKRNTFQALCEIGWGETDESGT